MSMAFSSLYKWAMAKVPETLQFSMAVLQEVSSSIFMCSFLSIFLLNIKSSKFAMFRLKNEKTLRIFSSILNSYKREKQLQPSKIFIKNSKNVLEMVTMICYNVSAFMKRYHSMTVRRPVIEEREA